SLRAAVEVEARPMLGCVRAHRAILRAATRCIMRLPAASGVPAVVGPDVTTDLETDIGAGNVEEALAVEGADLHVFDRLGLDGKIGSLRPRNCDKSCRRAEEKTFHHLHSNLQVALHGMVPSPPGAFSPQGWKVPFSPLVSSVPDQDPFQTRDPNLATGDAPSVATSHYSTTLYWQRLTMRVTNDRYSFQRSVA